MSNWDLKATSPTVEPALLPPTPTTLYVTAGVVRKQLGEVVLGNVGALTECVENAISTLKNTVFQVPNSTQEWTKGPNNPNTLIILIHKLQA